jgi:hypothetical protein
MLRRTLTATAVAASMMLMSGPAIAQQQEGLVIVNISQIDVSRVISDNQVQVQIPAQVQIPVQLAANVCGLSVAAILANAESTGVGCTASPQQTSDAELRAIAGQVRRQQQR